MPSTQQKIVQQFIAIIEVLIVFVLIVGVVYSEHYDFRYLLIWDESLFGFPAITKYVMYCVIPTSLVLIRPELRTAFGVRAKQLGAAITQTILAYSYLGPACITFWLINWLGYSHQDWEGSVLLTVAFGLAAYLLLIKMSRTSFPKGRGEVTPLGYLHSIPLVLMFISLIAFPKWSLLSSIIHYFFFVGFGEEILFRGYIQSRLNLSFGKPFQVFGISYGWGLILSTLLFGLIHIFNTSDLSWAWALFPLPLGVLFGFIREKTGDVLVGALLHGLIDLPLAFVE